MVKKRITRFELITKAKEAALQAVQVFNSPIYLFKAESFCVLMIIAWTYLLHAYYKKNKIDYRYFSIDEKGKRLI